MFEHIGWQDDSLAIRLFKCKHDQEGKDTKAKHVFANPVKPWICPILALGVHMFTMGPRRAGAKNLVFGNESAMGRFSRWLREIMRIFKSTLRAMGINIRMVGTHSFRKGTATYLTGMVDGPTGIAVRFFVLVVWFMLVVWFCLGVPPCRVVAWASKTVHIRRKRHRPAVRPRSDGPHSGRGTRISCSCLYSTCGYSPRDFVRRRSLGACRRTLTPRTAPRYPRKTGSKFCRGFHCTHSHFKRLYHSYLHHSFITSRSYTLGWTHVTRSSRRACSPYRPLDLRSCDPRCTPAISRTTPRG